MKTGAKILLSIALFVGLAGCQGRSVVEEENLIQGFEVITDGTLGVLEKILKGELDVSAMDDGDKEQFLAEIAKAREYVRKEKGRKP